MDYLETKELYHHGIEGQKWGVRRYQNEDGTWTKEGLRRRYMNEDGSLNEEGRDNYDKYKKYKEYESANAKEINKLSKSREAKNALKYARQKHRIFKVVEFEGDRFIEQLDSNKLEKGKEYLFSKDYDDSHDVVGSADEVMKALFDTYGISNTLSKSYKDSSTFYKENREAIENGKQIYEYLQETQKKGL